MDRNDRYLWSQYCGHQAGYYPDFSRRERRRLEIAARAAGLVRASRMADTYGWPHGAPGLWGGVAGPNELAARKAAARPGRLP